MTRLFTKSAVALVLSATSTLLLAAPVIDVHRDPNCGCCSAWISHLEAYGFDVHDTKRRDMQAFKADKDVPARLASCHTATVDGYVIEGHVPAQDIHRLLVQRPDVHGLSVPGMPHGSPGMETGRVDNYAVIGWTLDGKEPRIFQRHP